MGLHGREPASAASHDTPITVAAELGLPGLALLAWLAFAAFSLTLRRLSSSFAGRTALVCGVALAAIAVHSLFYNAFFEDPTTWGLLGLGALAARARAAPLESEAPQEDHDPSPGLGTCLARRDVACAAGCSPEVQSPRGFARIRQRREHRLDLVAQVLEGGRQREPLAEVLRAARPR